MAGRLCGTSLFASSEGRRIHHDAAIHDREDFASMSAGKMPADRPPGRRRYARYSSFTTELAERLGEDAVEECSEP